MREGRECISLGHFKEAIFELRATATNEDDSSPFVQLQSDAALMMAIHSSIVYMMRMKRNKMIQVCMFTLQEGSGSVSDFVMWRNNKFSGLPILTRILPVITVPVILNVG